MGKENPKCSLGKSQDYKAPSLGSTETGSTAFSEVLRDFEDPDLVEERKHDVTFFLSPSTSG